MDAFTDMTVLSLEQVTVLPCLTHHLAHGWDEGVRARGTLPSAIQTG